MLGTGVGVPIRAPFFGSLGEGIRALAPSLHWPLQGSLRESAVGGGTYDGVSADFFPVVPGPTTGDSALRFNGSSTNIIAPTTCPYPTGTVISVMVAIRMTQGTAVSKTIFCRRGPSSDDSWHLSTGAGGAFGVALFQGGGSIHATVTSTVGGNDNRWHLLTGTYDGTSLRLHVDARYSGVSTSLTGSWMRASAADIDIGSRSDSSVWVDGDIAHAAIWNDRIITLSEHLRLYSLFFGG